MKMVKSNIILLFCIAFLFFCFALNFNKHLNGLYFYINFNICAAGEEASKGVDTKGVDTKGVDTKG